MSERPRREAIHTDPVWRARADFIIAAGIANGGDVETEQLWVRQLGEHRFEMCCIPFYLYDISLGDVVETDEEYLVERVIERSGRYVFRVWFENSGYPRAELVAELEALGSLTEWAYADLLAVDSVDVDSAQRVADALAFHERAGDLRYEAGRT